MVTTREPLTDLADFQRREGSPWGSVLRVDLGNLTDEAGAALLHHAGAKRAGAAEIRPDDTELLTASREVDGHALTLNLLGRFLARAHGGDIRRRDLVKFEEADRKEQGGTTFKMLAAFENWFAKSGEFGARQLAVLRILGLFDRPADTGCIRALRKPPVIAGLTAPLFLTNFNADTAQPAAQPVAEEDWNTTTSFLADFALVAIQDNADVTDRLLDCHPLIREHFAKQQRGRNPEGWRAAHRRLYEYLCRTAPECTKADEIELMMQQFGLGEAKNKTEPTFEDLQPLYEAVAHGCQAGLQQEACDEVYLARIIRHREEYSWRKLGAFGSDLGAIACFFEQPWSRVSTALIKTKQAWLLASAAFALRALGRLTEALAPMRSGLNMRIEEENWSNAAQGSSNLSELGLTLGEITRSVADAEQAVIYADQSGNAFMSEMTRTTHADALHQAGRPAEAETRFREAEEMQAARLPEYSLIYALAGFQYCDPLLAASERAAWQAILQLGTRNSELGTAIAAVSQRAAQTLKIAVEDNWLLDIALDYLTLGRAALYEFILGGGGYTSAQGSSTGMEAGPTETTRRELGAVIDGLRRAGDVEFVARGLLTRALLRYLTGAHTGPESVQADLDEAWATTERGPMRLHLADIHLHRARLFFREKPYPWKSPQDDLAAAEKLINDCGYHRRDEELADAKWAVS